MQISKSSLRELFFDKHRNTTNMAIALLIFIVIACNCPKPENRNGSSNNSNNTSNSNTEKKKPNPKANQDKGDFIVAYPGVKDMKYQELDASIKQQKILENAAKQLNAALTLPRDVTIQSLDCGTPNAFYSPDKHAMYICYELMELFFDVFKREGVSDDEANTRMFNAIQFVFLHELGHALIHNYELGVAGKEEDVADQLATYVSIEEVQDGEKNALNGALTFMLLSKGQDTQKLPYYDEHSLGPQRYFNILCWLYGHSPQKYQDLVPKSLPEERAVRCSDEYSKFTKYWKKELKPFRKNVGENEGDE
jgi:hypothetical protein